MNKIPLKYDNDDDVIMHVRKTDTIVKIVQLNWANNQEKGMKQFK